MTNFFKKYGFAVCVAVFVVLRFGFLDADIPSYRVVNHTDTDQYYYTNGAVSFLHYNQFYTPFPPGKDYTRNLFDFFQNLWTAPFLKLFGNNLIAFKLPTVLISLWAIYLLFHAMILLKIKRNIVNIATLFLLTEFMLFISSRVQNPTIYSFFACSVLIYLIIRYEMSETDRQRSRYLFLSGLWGIWSVFLIYVFNTFLLAGLGTGALVYFIFIKKSFKPILIMAAGSVAGFLLYNLFTYIVYEKTIIDLVHDLKHFGGREDFRSFEELTIPLKQKFIQTTAAFFTMNFMRFNLFLFVVFTPALVFFAVKVIKEDDKKLLHMVLLFSLGFAFLQLWFEPSASAKKLTTLLPIYLIIMVQSINRFSITSLSTKQKLVYSLLAFIGLLSAVYCYSITTASWYENLRHGQNTPPYLNYINLSVALIFTVITLYVLFLSKRNKAMLGFMMLIALLPSAFFIFHYILTHRSYDFKNALIELSSISEGKNMAGEYPEALMLYNNFHAFRPYHTYKTDDEYLRLLEQDSVQIINLPTDRSLIKGYHYFEDRKLIDLNKGDTLLNGRNYYVLVDLKLEINQGKELYIGLRRSRSNLTK